MYVLHKALLVPASSSSGHSKPLLASARHMPMVWPQIWKESFMKNAIWIWIWQQVTACYLLPSFIVLKGALRQPELHGPWTDCWICTYTNSFSHFSKFCLWIHLPEAAFSMVFVLSQELSAQHSLNFPNPLFPPDTSEPAALQGRRDELLRREAAMPHEAPRQAQGAVSLCSASALCEA